MRPELPLAGVKVIAAFNGMELFGHERGNIEALKTLREQGAQVRVGVNYRPNNDVAMELHRLGFSTFALPFGVQWSIKWLRQRPAYAFANLLAVFRCSRVILEEVRRFRPTHIHIGSPLVYSFIAIALMLCRVPMVYRMGDCPPVDSPFNLRIWRLAMRRTTALVVNSEFVRGAVVRALGGYDRLGAGVLIYNIGPGKSALPERDSCQRSKERNIFRLAYVGALSEHKGLIHLIEAFEQVQSRFPSLHLDIVGGSRFDAVFRVKLGDYVARAGLSNKVSVHGHVANPSQYFRNASIHIVPSLCEDAAPNVVLEAKREGTPSIVYPSGGLPELVNHQTDGFVCREKSVEALVEGLYWLLSNPARLGAMRIAAKRDSEKRFGPERFARDWIAIYRPSLEETA